MMEFKYCELLLPLNVLRVLTADSPENPIRFPNGSTPPRALLNDAQLQEIVTQWGTDAATDSRELVAEKSREWWDKGMNHAMVLLCCHILGIPCAASSPKGPLVELLVSDGARPIWPSTATEWYQRHRTLFPEMAVPAPIIPGAPPVADAANALNRLVLHDQQDHQHQRDGPTPPPLPVNLLQQQEVPPVGVPTPPTMFVMSDAQLALLFARHGSGVQLPAAATPLPWQCQSTKLLLRVQGAVNAGAYVELSSICRRRIEELKQSATMPRSTTKLSGGLEISTTDPQPVPESDMFQLELIRSGSTQYLSLIQASPVPAIVAQYTDRRKFFDNVFNLPYPQPSIARYVRAFILKYSAHPDWCAQMDSDAMLIANHLGSLGGRNHYRDRSRSPPRKPKQSPRDRDNDRGRGRDSSRTPARGRDQTRDSRTPSGRNDRPSTRTGPRPIHYCNSRVDPAVGECKFGRCRYDHHCASCQSSATHTARDCPSFNASKAKTEADRRKN